MSPKKFKSVIEKIGLIVLFFLFIVPRIYLSIAGKTMIGEFENNKSNTMRNTNGAGTANYDTYFYSYEVNGEIHQIEASDFYINDFREVKIIYNPHFPDQGAIKSPSGIFFMPTLLFIAACFVWLALTGIVLKK